MTAKLTLVSWNIDGVARLLPGADTPRRKRATSPDRPQTTLAELHASLGRPDILCLQEIRLRPEDAAAIEQLERALPGYACAHALPRDRWNVKFRGGRAYGVATFVRAQLSPRWRDTSRLEREGRLVACDLPPWNLHLANVYAVNGTDRPYFDPRGAPIGDRHAYKLQFQRQLLSYFSEVRDAGRRLLLAGDWNVTPAPIDTHPRLRTEEPHATARAMLTHEFTEALDLVDIYRAMHPTERKYTWFNRVAARYGRLDAARVDYALLSRALQNAVCDAEILDDWALRYGSDHAPIRVTLDLAEQP